MPPQFNAQAAINSQLRRQFGDAAFVNGQYNSQAALNEVLRRQFGPEAFVDGRFNAQAALNSILRRQFGPEAFGEQPGPAPGIGPIPGSPQDPNNPNRRPDLTTTAPTSSFAGNTAFGTDNTRPQARAPLPTTLQTNTPPTAAPRRRGTDRLRGFLSRVQ